MTATVDNSKTATVENSITATFEARQSHAGHITPPSHNTTNNRSSSKQAPRERLESPVQACANTRTARSCSTGTLNVPAQTHARVLEIQIRKRTVKRTFNTRKMLCALQARARACSHVARTSHQEAGQRAIRDAASKIGCGPKCKIEDNCGTGVGAADPRAHLLAEGGWKDGGHTERQGSHRARRERLLQQRAVAAAEWLPLSRTSAWRKQPIFKQGLTP